MASFALSWADDVTWSDQFGGGGGFAEGAERVRGARVVVAGNHALHAWETYRANHPTVDVRCADLSQVVPAHWPRTHALWSSPECTWQTVAQGKPRGYGEFVDGPFSTTGVDETAIRSRATIYCVPRFAEHHQYAAIVVENVAEARWWGPKHNRGAAFDAWLGQMRAWGYQHRILYLNSAHFASLGPAAACSRDRMYVVFWHESLGRVPNFDKWTRPYTICQRHGRVQAVQAWKHTDTSSPQRPWGKHGTQYVWLCPNRGCATVPLIPAATRPGSDAVDWSRPGRLIADRFQPNTRRKVEDGHRVYGGAPFIAELRGGGSTHRALTDPLSTITAGGNHHLLVHGDAPDMRDRYARVLDIDERKVAMGFPADYQLIATAEKSKDRDKQRIGAITAEGNHHMLVKPGRTVDDCQVQMISLQTKARAQRFPDDHVFQGNTAAELTRQVGNAVPVNAAYWLAQRVLPSLN